ncbi:polyamine ABC transporter substrate-binding protein [Oceanithermus sp.]
MKKPVVLAALALLSLTLARGELRIFNWSEYIPEEVLQEFEQRYDVRIIYDTFEAPEAMMAKLQGGGYREYDLVVPPDYYVAELARSGLIRPLDHSRIPNLTNLYPEFQNPDYDPDNAHSVPYQWGTTGIAYRQSEVPGGVDSWAVFFDPEAYKGPFILLDEMRETIGAALKYLGYSLNDTDPAHLEEAGKLLIDAKKRSLGFADSVGARSRLLAGDAAVVHNYSGDIFAVQEEDDDIVYVIPKEGGTIWVDALAIPSQAPHPDLAYEFINFVLEPRVAATISNYNYYASPVQAAEPYLDAELLNNPAVYPTPAVRARLEFIHDLGEATVLYDRIWTEVKAR